MKSAILAATRCSAVENKGKTDVGIYEVHGDKLMICFGKMGKDRPTAWKTQEHNQPFVGIFKRET